jgi:hypothetical protein
MNNALDSVSTSGELNSHRQKTKAKKGNKFRPINNSLGHAMTDKIESSFAVVRFNERTYEPGGVVAVIKGTESAERILNDFDWCQSEENRRAGWRYFLEETDMLPGMDPEKATTLRQVRLDLQES